ncbi:MAG: hypothetical protein ABNG98_06965 [Flavobacterium sp.]|jgi:hypothetical protein
MIFKRVILLILFTFSGLLLLFQNSEGLVQKFIELRQTYIIEKSDSQTTFIFSKKDYLSLKNTKEIIVNNKYYDIKKAIHFKNIVKLHVIEDKNESFLKFMSHSLKNGKNKKDKAKIKRGLTLDLHHKEEREKNFISIKGPTNNFYLKENKYLKIIIPLLKPPIV